MSFDYPEFFVGDVCSVGDGAHSKVVRVQEGIPYLTSKNIGQGVLKLDNYDCISDVDFNRLFPVKSSATRRPIAGDILIGIIGTFGNAYLYKDGDCFGFSSSIGIIRPNKEILNSKFLYYVLTSQKFRTTHLNYNAGSVQGYTNIPTIKKLKVPIPPLTEQKEIASILSALDDRISLLRETNTTLEAIAQTLFKSWFVDFDPVKAKAEGCLPEGMDEATAALFPSEFEESALGLIPKGWRVEKFGNVIDKYIDNRGKTPPLVKNGIPLIEIKHLLENNICPSIDTDKQVSQETFDTWFRAHPQKNDILISTVGTIGRLSLMGNEQLAIAQNILGLRVGSVIQPEYFYYLMKDSRFISDVDARLVITVQASIKRKDLETIDLLVPPKDVQQAFTYLVSSLVDKQIENQQKSRTLANLRDTLLPRLISGQLRLNQAQDLVDEVTA